MRGAALVRAHLVAALAKRVRRRDVNDDIIVLKEFLSTPEGDCCKVVGTITPDPAIHGEGAGIAIRKGETELAEKFNKAIDAIRANGKYKEINDKYFDFDAYGG